MKTDEKSRQRAEVILQVRAGKLTVKQGAQILGISRKSYYEWERRGLSGMMEELQDREMGRPMREIDPEKQKLQEQIEELKKRNAELLAVSEIRKTMLILDGYRESKKNKKSKKS